jgi:hypothetical protein
MKVRFKGQPSVTGHASQFNVRGLTEVIVGFDGEGGMDSCFIADLEVFVEARQEWKPMRQAFKDRDLIPDNFNTRFAEPKDETERTRGYY